ncbi:uncharacterized protein VP01_677g3 [Puccinia sorghi]|uniref:Uncharacterized protein n=1 Tax=Puccinia sorghi TaxID=27349 RepID=A0A0L6UGR8_9BASI|nr:uncharacterized protein VP01_677g3 [Puccinia sorghi]
MQDFNQHARITGWADTPLMILYQRGLKENIQLAVVMSNITFDSLWSIFLWNEIANTIPLSLINGLKSLIGSTCLEKLIVFLRHLNDQDILQLIHNLFSQLQDSSSIGGA